MPKEINITDSKKEIVESKPIPQKEDSVLDTTKELEKPEIVDKTINKDKPKEKKKLSKKQLWLIITIVALVILTGISAFYYFGIYKAKPYKKPSEVINLNSEFFTSNKVEATFFKFLAKQPEEPRTEESPLNGLLFTNSEMKELLKRRPVAVMINNHAEARPQSGLNSADVVYEALAESGITRYMAIFWSEAPDKVGPIRSARQYYIEWLSPYDALYIHDGCAETTNPKTNACGNIHTYNIKDISTIGAWRWNDGRRYAPHNEYSSITNAWEYAQKMSWDNFPSIESWKFKNDANTELRGDKTKVKIVFHQALNNSGYYDTTWTYDSKSNTYLKSTGNQPDIDQEDNSRVYAKNVVIQETILTPANDEKGRIILDTIGNGRAVYLIDGKITEGTWKKEARTDRTAYYDKDGNEIQFNRGRIWISVVPRNQGKFDIIEQ